MSKNEADVKAHLITPALTRKGWILEDISHEYSYKIDYEFTAGRIELVDGRVRRGEKKRVDYLLKIPRTQINLAIIEAKSADKGVSEGLSQAMDYANDLKCHFAYASNGSGFVEYDFFTGVQRELKLKDFPTPSELCERYYKGKGLNDEQISITQTPYDLSKNQPRYYQANAINAAIEAIARGQRRVLLIMATGTGKTYTAFQIAHILYKSKKARKILYLADRNILIEQSLKGDFKPFRKLATKIKNHIFDSSYEIYFGIYQQFISQDENGESIKHYIQENGGFGREFFDLIFVDECHRGSVKDDSQWREILEYFSPAIQIGLTATPRHKEQGSNIDYFGEPVYTYSLKNGVQDGFLAPYKVIRSFSNLDIQGYRPEKGKLDKKGVPIPDKTYTSPDFNREIYIDERTKAVARRVTEFLQNELKDPYARTIVFCEDEIHALDMKDALIKCSAKLMRENYRYIVRITGSDNEGKNELENFISTKERYPVIATTSKLLSTGVDTKMAKLIVIDKNINSMSEFKQIIGRGTRIVENKGKNFFVIMDFKGATTLFSNPEFDSDEIKDKLPETKAKKDGTGGEKEQQYKFFIDGVWCFISHESEQILDAQGKLITSDFKAYSKNNALSHYKNLKDFLAKWHSSERKSKLLAEFEGQGILVNELRQKKEFENLDEFDIILSLAFNQAPLTRKERAKKANKVLAAYEGKAREILEILLDKYAQNGIADIENKEFYKNSPFTKFGDLNQIYEIFGGSKLYKKALNALKDELYKEAS